MSLRERLVRLLAGFILAPLTPLVLLLGIAISSGGIGWRDSLPMIAIGVPAGYAAAVVLGIPLFVLLRWRRWDGLAAYSVGGALAGVAACVLFALLHAATPGEMAGAMLRASRGMVPFIVVCALAISLAFWLIARPDQFDVPSDEDGPSNDGGPA